MTGLRGVGLCCLLLLLGLPIGVRAQEDGVVATFVGTPEDVFYDVTPTSDGGVVAVGYTTRLGAGGRDVLLVKADSCGDVVWKQTLGGSGNEEGRSVIELPGGDLAIAGQTSSTGGPGDHLLVSRLSSLGNEIWTRVLADPDVNPQQLRGYDLMRDSSGNLVVTGTVWDVSSTYSVLLVKFTSGGSFLGAAAYRELGGILWDLWGESVTEACDGNYIVVGGATHPSNGQWALMAKIGPNLLIVDWSRYLQEDGAEAVAHAVTRTADDKFVLTGETGGRLFVSKRECSDPPVANWQKKLQNASEGHNILQTSGNGLVVVGALGAQVLAGSWNANGAVAWLRGWGAGVGYGVAEDVENRIWVAGANGTDALLVKLDPEGYSCYSKHVQPLNPVDWNPTQDGRSLTWHALPTLEASPWTVDSASVSLQPSYDCDDECPEACCLDDGRCDATLTPDDCGAQGGQPQGPGTDCDPNPCLGACCYDDGTCDQRSCDDCGHCRGDMNCDGQVDFGDINPFVLFLSNFSAWRAAYPCCNPRNGDINCDGSYPSFGDINPFVTELSSGDLPIPCGEPITRCPPGSDTKSPYWGGYGTSCDPNDPNYGCCTVVVPPGANLENESSNCTEDHYDGGCDSTPLVFLAIPSLPYTIYGESGTFAGQRDTDWYQYVLATSDSLVMTVEAEFDPLIRIIAPGPDSNDPCTGSVDVVAPAFGQKCTNVRLRTGFVPAGTYWFVVAPNSFDGVACGADYRMTVTLAPCPDPCTDPVFQPIAFQEGEPTCGPGYVDVTDGGCDAGAPYHTKPIGAIDTTGLNYDYCGGSGAWLDPDFPGVLQRDYDWYSFTTPTTPANGRWYIYLYSEFPTTWEIWPANSCAAGPIEGLEMPRCYYTSVRPAQCYPANTTYWLRVFPTDASPACGESDYYLGLFNYGGCSACSINCSGATDNDNPCDDVNDYDTNFGCHGDPNGTYTPTAFLAYSVGGTYCGRCYATAGDYDADWFTIGLAATTDLRLRIQAEFPAFVGLYAGGSDPNNPSCAAYDAGMSVGEVGLLAACSGTTPTNLNFPGLAAGVYVGVIYPIDYFGNLLTRYYPCGTHNDYKIIVTTYAP